MTRIIESRVLASVMIAGSIALAMPASLAQTSAPEPPATPVAGRPLPLPDLTVKAGYSPNPTCVNGKWLLVIVADITNLGPGPAFLPAEWTKPWLTAYPSKPLKGFVQPFYTPGQKMTLKKGETVQLEFSALFGEAVGGGGYDVIVKVDPYNVIKEANENNNTDSFAVPGGC
ncbi:MAG: CARDB domain-containing protein [Alphaproteobacteria bacterium]